MQILTQPLFACVQTIIAVGIKTKAVENAKLLRGCTNAMQMWCITVNLCIYTGRQNSRLSQRYA